MLVQISSGQGPEECQLAVGKLFKAWKAEFPDIEEVSSKAGRREGCFHSIMFAADNEDTKSAMTALEGSVLWICKSSLRPGHKRKNWFIDVSIIPEQEEVPVDEDYRIEKFHSGGKGGQNVNKVETGIRVIHVPTGITVVCTDERSQYMNKQKAIKRVQTLLSVKTRQAADKQTNQAWREHNRIVRGYPVRIYEGDAFKLKRPNNQNEDKTDI